ncbi:hypothetical protein CBR_g20113 [Chara braunii]|uniref:Uncharacterized protein n=1 Tax=Chara braunii TaxID=69332 RepID=A0A388KZS1_CHABU|nr:hypothetical protein CBR_g20113 [Chara braunii]|eukprot:GBG75482.1 hypothetical protein CBR_g20113 [Chara braunii]
MTAEGRVRVHVAAMEGGGEGRRDVLTPRELQAVAAAVSTIVLRCQQERALGRLKEQLRARRWRTLTQGLDDGAEYVATSDTVVQLCYALGCGVIPRATPRWWVKCRTGGTWEELRQCDDVTNVGRHRTALPIARSGGCGCRSAVGKSSIHPLGVLGRSPSASRDQDEADETHMEEDNDEKQHDDEEQQRQPVQQVGHVRAVERATNRRFKIESELGTRCVTANYTANGTAPYVRTPIDFSTIPFGSLPAMAPPPSGHSSTPTAPDGLLDEESTPTESERIEQLGFNLSALVPPPEGVGKAVKVLNRGENVTSPVVLEAVLKISLITRKALSSLATTTCPLVSSESAQRIKSAATEEGSRSAQAIARSADGILQSIAQIVEAAMEVVHGVESITFGIAEVNQGHYDEDVKHQIASGSSVVNEAAREISRQANNVKRNVNEILKLASSLSDTTVAKTVIQETQKISSLILTTMSAGVEIKETAETIRKESSFISKQGILRPRGIAVTGRDEWEQAIGTSVAWVSSIGHLGMPELHQVGVLGLSLASN